MAAEAIGFDIGRPLLVVNCAQLMDKYVGESAKNIEKVFEEAKAQDVSRRRATAALRPRDRHGLAASSHLSTQRTRCAQAVLVFDECEGLFAERGGDSGSTSRHDSMNVGVLLHHMEVFGGVVIAITNRYMQASARIGPRRGRPR